MIGGDLAVLSLLALVALIATWQSFTPLRANVAVQNGDSLARQGDGTGALGAFGAFDKASDLLPDQALYWGKKGALFRGASPPQTSQALAAYRRAAEADPYDVNALKAAAAVAKEEGSLDLSREHFSRAVEVDPLNPETLVAAATFELRHGGAEAARALLEDAVRRLPEQAALWATLGDARAVLGDAGGARAAYERALVLQPGQETATQGLTKLTAATP